MILVHGIASTQATWSAVIAPLSRHFRCIAYDLRAHGANDPQPPAHSLDELIEDLEALRDRLNLHQARLVGHSLGACIVLGYARKYPSRVQSAALLAAPAARSERERRAGLQLIEAMQRQGVRQVLASLAAHWYTPQFVRRQPGALAARLAEIASLQDAAVIGSYQLYYRTEIAPWLTAVTIPVLVMTGEDARGCGSKVAQFIAGELPDAALVILAGQRNGILTEVPERVSAELLRFFSAH